MEVVSPIVPGAAMATGFSSIRATTYAQWLVSFCPLTSTTFSSSITSRVHIAKPEKSLASPASFSGTLNCMVRWACDEAEPGLQKSNSSSTCGLAKRTMSLVLPLSRSGCVVPGAALPLLMIPRFLAKFMIRCSVYFTGAICVCTACGIICGHTPPAPLNPPLRKRCVASLMMGSTPSWVAMLPMSSDTIRSTLSGRSTCIESPVMTSMVPCNFSFSTVFLAISAASAFFSMA
mmetsp:Transcript_14110/g.38809  ORF Transcript_14110/g.38809 Transcript_14110/m.38809 type:complete len:233 (-) Transcript_14110:351-1049(-)